MRWNIFRRRNRSLDSIPSQPAAHQTANSVSDSSSRAVTAPPPDYPEMPPSAISHRIEHDSLRPAPARSSSGNQSREIAAPRDLGIFEFLGNSEDYDNKPRFSAIRLKCVDLFDNQRVGVVGESHYQQALALAADGAAAGDIFEEHIPAVAVMVPEPTNPYDRNAVRIDVLHGTQALTVGYLSRIVAPFYQPSLLKLKSKGQLGTCTARITGGGPGRYYGIYLHVAYPDSLFGPQPVGPEASFSRVLAESILLNADSFCTVTREEDHQDTLKRHFSRYSSIERPGEFVLDFCSASKGKYRGERVIEVRIGVDRVGELTVAMTKKHAELVDVIVARRATPLCHGHIDRDERRGYQVTLHMPSNSARRWRTPPWAEDWDD